ncbi:hypothetical protein BDF14DRAFT_1779120, partial [Spinellus fusiger]
MMILIITIISFVLIIFQIDRPSSIMMFVPMTTKIKSTLVLILEITMATFLLY